MDKLTQAFDFRHACKIFDETKKISLADIHTILEAGRNSPSSFGLEPWHFLVIDNKKLKQKLQPVCYDQAQVSSCSHFVIVLYRKAVNFTLQSDYLRKTIARELPDGSDQTAIDIACQSFINFCEKGLAEGLTMNHWAEMQSYIATTNMMTTAAYISIDSCIIGGFQHDKMIQILEQNLPQFSGKTFGIGLCLALGYRVNEPGEHIRWPLADIATFLPESQ